MRRLRDIQGYLGERCDGCKNQTNIFSGLKSKSFVVKYVSTSSSMQQLDQKIRKSSEVSRKAKISELEKWWREYDEHSLGFSGGTCTCKLMRDGTRNVKGCTKCWHWRSRRRMNIYAHEEFLPKNAVEAAAVIFELGIPDSFAAYRNVTWKMFMLAYPNNPQSGSPEIILGDYEPLKLYAPPSSSGIVLASKSKPFRGTHYKVSKKKMRASESDVLYPNGLNLFYFDTATNTWVQDFDKPLTFQHECGVHVPLELRSSLMQGSLHPAIATAGPSSYEIVASETECPSSMSLHEFTAYQRLLSGTTRRWLTMLVELGASNVNFSSESTMHMFNHLSTQLGPAKDKNDILGDIHAVFKDVSFCNSLAAQIEKRLSGIASNWREVHCMEVMITLCLRLFVLAPLTIQAKCLLDKARRISLSWITRLRAEVRNAKSALIAETSARYAFWAALLCRRTFSHIKDSDVIISETELPMFVEASLALQEHLLVDLTKLPPVLKRMLIRDAKLTYKIRSILLNSIIRHPHSISTAINASWSEGQDSAGRSFSDWQQVSPIHDRWVVSIMERSKNDAEVRQVVHYNFIEGHLLIDGKPLGRLPHDIRESMDVKKLFGSQNLLTFPSAEFGMSYVLASQIYGHEIHFGFRHGCIIIRAWCRGQLLEYIPSHHFTGTDTIDLPDGLISNCVHWLNLNSRCLEIRRQASLWITRPNDWKIDIAKRMAQRKNVLLIDPNSQIFKQVADIFRHFEDSQKITIFQPIHSKGSLSVELRHLELSFLVNLKGLLQCRELNAEIDPNQDAGTLYGLESKIVLRDVEYSKIRSVIIPYGQISFRRHGMHVAVRAASSTDYAKFRIDDVLGRLSCPPEPRLLYAKAQFHAYTSFVIPDSLTGRTGTEEALIMLKSGHCQPWQPLGDAAIQILNTIATLSPKREYYPVHKQALQTVFWNEKLTATIQHDAYEGLVQKILDKSNRLRIFAQNEAEEALTCEFVASHLRSRGLARRSIYERRIGDINQTVACDKIYNSRGQQAKSMQARKVFQIANLLHSKPFRIHTNRELSVILQDWQLIGGFHETGQAEFASLSDLVDRSVDEQWGSLVNICRHADIEEPYSLIFRLSLMSLNPNTDLDAIKILTAFASLPALRNLVTPSFPSFNHFKYRETPTLESIYRVISADLLEKHHKFPTRAEAKHREVCLVESKRLAQHFLRQWPQKSVVLDGFNSDVIDVGIAFERVVPEWDRLHSNLALSEYVTSVQDVLRDHRGLSDTSHPKAWNIGKRMLHEKIDDSAVRPSLRHLLSKSLTVPLRHESCEKRPASNKNLSTDPAGKIKHDKPMKEILELRRILSAFAQVESPLRQQYGHDLKTSLDALERTSSNTQFSPTIPNITANERCIYDLRAATASHLSKIRDCLSQSNSGFPWLILGDLWPCTTSLALLEHLRSVSHIKLGDFVQDTLLNHGILITQLQRLVRIQIALNHGNSKSIQDELENSGHENWSPIDWPDWLLLEVDSDILIRQEQVDVARAIIAPESRNNTVLQLNMGKGKTSCIVPMAMAVIGDGKQLSRLIVPKSLLLPTAQMIQSRLGGLVGREIRHIPFSRRTNCNAKILQLHRDLHREVLESCGVVLVAPEHLLSYKLSGLQHLASNNLETARQMIEFQTYLSSKCRDVLDESDVSLAVKTQLIYPSGKQTTVDGHPHRWQVAQSLLSLVKDHLPDLARNFPRKIEVLKRGQGYPMIYILQEDVEEALHRSIVDDICTGRTSFLRFADSTTNHCSANLRKVLLENVIDKNLLNSVADLFTDKDIAFKTLLLVRGLLRNRILLLCLRKRWNVQYGLHPSRDPMAVPFDAKGVPSEQNEFGHPDAAILFTCLAFYYTGLNLVQFQEALRFILASHDPTSEYERWTSTCDSLPEALHYWNVINSDDQEQVEELWRHLRTNIVVLNHYMNHFVFVAHAKQFEVKLQASGWDLPLFSRTDVNSTPSEARTTGFSGTNDNKSMLPLTIQQSDLTTLLQTNAEVLTYLLQGRNRTYELVARAGKRLSEEDFLRQLKYNRIRILIDAGAYILEMSNEDLAKKWMDIDTEPQAAVYFGADNRAWVRYRGTKARVPLLATPFVDNLNNCLVYLDEAHTRGVDLKLPQDACGALTLALGQTKDHTMQAAMRLRQLATTQSIRFFAFPETHQSILDVCRLNDNDRPNSSHVIHWLLEQTCRMNEQLQPLYISQGNDFCRRMNANWKYANFLSDARDRSAYVKVLQHPEQQMLEQLYGNFTGENQDEFAHIELCTQLQAFRDKLNRLRLRCPGTTNAFHSALEEVEQEREVEFEVEEVREVQKFIRYQAHAFPGLHPAISSFVKTGHLRGNEGYEHVFNAISRTSIGKNHRIIGSDSCLFVSAEFMKTVKTDHRSVLDNFLRPVEWILYSPKTATAIVIISEEAEILIPRLRSQSSPANVHLLTYSAPVTKKMLPFSGLRYYSLPELPDEHSIPPKLATELGIFAGRLFMEFRECVSLVEYIDETTSSGRSDAKTTNTINLILEWLSLRRKGQDIMHTPIGYICQGLPLNEEHAFFARNHTVVTTSSAVDQFPGGRGVIKDQKDNDEEEEENENWSEMEDTIDLV